MGVENLFKEMLQNIPTLAFIAWQFQISIALCIFFLCNCVNDTENPFPILPKCRRKCLQILQHLKLDGLICSLQKQKPRSLTGENNLLCGSAAGISSHWRASASGDGSFSLPEFLLSFTQFLPAMLTELCFFFFQCLVFDGRGKTMLFSSRQEVSSFAHPLIFLFFLSSCSPGRDL